MDASCPYHHHHRADKQGGAPFDRVRPSCSTASQLPAERLSCDTRDTSLSLRAHPGFVHTFLKRGENLTYILGMQTSFPDRAEIGEGVKEFRATLLRSDNKQEDKSEESPLSCVPVAPEFCDGHGEQSLAVCTWKRRASSMSSCVAEKPLWMRRMQSGVLLRCKTHTGFSFL